MLRNCKNRSFLCSAVLGLLVLIVSCASVAGQQNSRTELPFARGEQLVYQAELNRGLLRGFDVGELRFSAKIANGNDEHTINLIGDAVAKGLLIRLTGSKYHVHMESL